MPRTCGRPASGYPAAAVARSSAPVPTRPSAQKCRVGRGSAEENSWPSFAAPLPAGTLMTNTQFEWSGTTWSGDIVINTSYLYSIGQATGRYDLYTAALNEAGNVLGVLDSRTDTAAAAYYQYVGVKAGLD